MNFIQEPVDLGYEDLVCITKESGRKYITPDGNAYPSVTTFLGASGDKTWLENWKKAVGEEEAKRVGRIAAKNGESIHNTVERYLANKEPFEKKPMPNIKYGFNQLKKELDQHVNKVRALEVPLYSDMLKLAGRVDIVAEWDNILSIVDIKTSNSYKKASDIEDYFLQATIYSLMLEERTGLVADQIIILMVVNSGKVLVFKDSRMKWIKKLYNRWTVFNNT